MGSRISNEMRKVRTPQNSALRNAKAATRQVTIACGKPTDSATENKPPK